MGKRRYGTGALWVRVGADGVETWYGRWWVDGKRHKRALGVKRPDVGGEGLTRMQAEERLATMMGRTRPRPGVATTATAETSYPLLRRTLQEVARAERQAADRDERQRLAAAREALYRAEDALIRAH